VEDFLSGGSGNFVRVRSPQSDALVTLLRGQGVTVVRQAADTLSIAGTTTEVVGQLARANGLTVLELSAHRASLEERYMELTKDSVDYEATEGGELAPVRR
jgi:ABC-2 type transport system ATP-binding protein